MRIECPCGIAKQDCTYHAEAPKLAEPKYERNWIIEAGQSLSLYHDFIPSKAQREAVIAWLATVYGCPR